MENKGKYYITTAIAYASQKPHVGNSYDIVVSDAIARFKKSQGYDVFFCTGADEHGQKIENLAAAANIEPQQYVDNISSQIQDIWKLLGTSHDCFIRTTNEHHVKTVQKIFKKFYDQGNIYKDSYEGWYCVPCESFFTDTQAEGGICPDCGRPLRREKEEAYFFKMSKYQDMLLEHINSHPDFIAPEGIKKEMVNNFIVPGLQDLCVSRSSFKWGIPVEFDPKHVVYVWLDALTNYITALGYDCDNSSDKYKKYWPANVHVIGKDIARFHVIYWPIFLMALGEPLPEKIFAHPWFLFGTDKMSKSKGNVIYSDTLVKHFGVDATRYYFLSEMPYSSDGSITYASVISRFNTDLANTVGNLLARTLSMTKKYFDGVIPCPEDKTEFDDELIASAKEAYNGYVSSMESFHVADALDHAMDLARHANKYIDLTMPWALAKDEAKRGTLKTVIYNLLESLRIIGLLLSAAMPESSKKMLDSIGAYTPELEAASEFGKLETGKTVGESFVLFARIDEQKKLDEIQAELDAKNA